jgi:hypothetical protein
MSIEARCPQRSLISSLVRCYVASRSHRVQQPTEGGSHRAELLAGGIGVIDAARQIDAFRGDRVEVDEFNPDFVTFLAIASETDDLPLAEARSHWAADALADKDREIARCEQLYRAKALEAASHLIARFADEKSPESEHTLHAQDI